MISRKSPALCIKKTFSLVDGSNLNGDDFKIATYPIKVVENEVFVGFVD
ncbi:hypothetical protein AAGS39_31010 [Flavobacterium sp. CGRL2]